MWTNKQDDAAANLEIIIFDVSWSASVGSKQYCLVKQHIWTLNISYLFPPRAVARSFPQKPQKVLKAWEKKPMSLHEYIPGSQLCLPQNVFINKQGDNYTT